MNEELLAQIEERNCGDVASGLDDVPDLVAEVRSLKKRVEAWRAMAESAFECININEYHGDEVTIQSVRPGEWDDLWGLFDIARKLEEES